MKVAFFSIEKYDGQHLLPAFKAHLGEENIRCLNCRLGTETSDLAGEIASEWRQHPLSSLPPPRAQLFLGFRPSM
jgi:hypothetical protein